MSAVSSSPIITTGPRGLPKQTSEFSQLVSTMRDAGLLRRTRGFYLGVFAALTLALAAAATGSVLIGHSWFQLLIAAALGVIFTQYAFLAHEAAHRQVFESGPRNDRAGRVLASLFVGISYSWWMTKHSRHHANPNTVGKDPDIEPDFIHFQADTAATVSGIKAWFIRRQGWLFFPLLLLEGINLHARSYRILFGRERVDGRGAEIVMVLARTGLYLAVIFAFLPVGMAFAFLGVQLAVFGLYMGASFAPNHKGMPQLPAGSRVDFLRRQVLTSRNIRGGWAVTTFMGGLNHQIEHHLFPSMPRPHLAKARAMVREYCERRDISYTEASLVQSYRIVIDYLNRVGLSARDPFDCPVAGKYGR